MATTSFPSTLQFSILSSALAKEVASLSRIVSNNVVMPILSNILLDLQTNQLTLTASDLNTTATATLSVKSEGEGKIAVPATLLLETLRNLPEQPIDVTIDNAKYSITIKAQNGEYRIACENAADFPTMPDVAQQKTIQVDVKTLKKAIKQTVFAAGKDEMRPALAGVNITIDEKQATFVAIDGHRLVRYIRHDIQSPTPYQVTIGVRPLQLITQLLPDNSQKVAIMISEKYVFFWLGHMQIITAIIDETYPDYENIIPKDNPHKMSISKSSFLNATKIIAYYANKTTHQILLALQKDHLDLHAEDLQFSNQAHTKLPCQYQGPELKIGLNANLVLELVNHLPHTNIQFLLDSPQKAILIESAEKSQEPEEVLMLIMPVLIRE